MVDRDDIKNAFVNEVIFRLYEESLKRILKCLDQLDDKQIWWRPNEESNSIGNLVLHLCGNVSQWIYTGMGGNNDSRNRQSEFDERGPLEKQKLLEKLNQTMEMVRPVIMGVTNEELLRKRPVQTFEETGISILIHVTEHFSYHTGQIAYISKLLLDRPLGFYDGIKLQ